MTSPRPRALARAAATSSLSAELDVFGEDRCRGSPSARPQWDASARGELADLVEQVDDHLVAERGDPDPAVCATSARIIRAPVVVLPEPGRALDRQARSIEPRGDAEGGAPGRSSPSSTRDRRRARVAAPPRATVRHRPAQHAAPRGEGGHAQPDTGRRAHSVRGAPCADFEQGVAVGIRAKSAQRHDTRRMGVVTPASASSRPSRRPGRSPPRFPLGSSVAGRTRGGRTARRRPERRCPGVRRDTDGRVVLRDLLEDAIAGRPSNGSFWSARSSSSIFTSSWNRQNSALLLAPVPVEEVAEQFAAVMLRRPVALRGGRVPRQDVTRAATSPGLAGSPAAGSLTPARGRSPQRSTASPARASSQSRRRQVDTQSSRL